MNTRGQESVQPIGVVGWLLLLLLSIVIFLAFTGRLGSLLAAAADLLRIGRFG